MLCAIRKSPNFFFPAKKFIRNSFCSQTDSRFEILANKELETVADSVDSQIGDNSDLDASVELHEGVLTIDFSGPKNGTFVINKHTASRQIWYSSPVSSPAYFDPVDSEWISKRLGMSLRNKLVVDVEKLVNIRLDL